MVSPLQEYENNNCERWKVMQDIPPWITEPLVRVLGATFFQIDENSIKRGLSF